MKRAAVFCRAFFFQTMRINRFLMEIARICRRYARYHRSPEQRSRLRAQVSRL